MYPISLPNVSIVVIGHNEGKSLGHCFKAIGELNYPADKIEIIYVDSQSTDNSIEIARRYTNKIFLERSNWPTAGEAFNRGIVESSHDFIHITAGDIQLHKDYLLTAIQTLVNRKDIVAVTGYFVEKNNSGWNKLLAWRREEETDISDHFTETPNGGTFRREALEKVNGYDERIKKGQETELGKRFALAGFKILYKHIPQGIHDFSVDSFCDMVNRFITQGMSLGYLFLLSGDERENNNLISFRKAAVKNLILFSSLIILIIIFIFKNPLYSLAIVLFYHCTLSVYLLYKQRKKTKNHRKYFVVNSLFSVFIYFGMVKFFLENIYIRLSGDRIIRPRTGLFLPKKDNE